MVSIEGAVKFGGVVCSKFGYQRFNGFYLNVGRIDRLLIVGRLVSLGIDGRSHQSWFYLKVGYCWELLQGCLFTLCNNATSQCHMVKFTFLYASPEPKLYPFV